MAMNDMLAWTDTTLLNTVERRSGAPVGACFQCHKCSSGCPVGPDMDLLSSQIMRLVHLGAQDQILDSEAIWACASCEACTTRCPMGIDVAAVMDTLRMMAIEREAATSDPRARRFNKTFLTNVRWTGRVFEFGMMAWYKLINLDPFSDMGTAKKMWEKGKLVLIPHLSKSAKDVRRIFQRAEEEEKKR